MKQTRRRWRLVFCATGNDRQERADAYIKCLKQEGFKAKVWCPLPKHKTSGHVHVVALCTLAEKLAIGFGIRKKYGTRPCPQIPELLKSLEQSRGATPT